MGKTLLRSYWEYYFTLVCGKD